MTYLSIIENLCEGLNEYHTETSDLKEYWNVTDPAFQGDGYWTVRHGDNFPDKIYFQLRDDSDNSDVDGLSISDAIEWYKKLES